MLLLAAAAEPKLVGRLPEAPADLALDDGFVYAVKGRGLWRLPLGGGDAEPLADLDWNAAGVVVDETSVYLRTWNNVDSEVWVLAKSDGRWRRLAALRGRRVVGMGARPDALIALDAPAGPGQAAGRLLRIERRSGRIAVMARGLADPTALAVAGADVFYADGSKLYRAAPRAAPRLVATETRTSTSVRPAPEATPPAPSFGDDDPPVPTVKRTAPFAIDEVGADEAHVYWLAGGLINKIARDGGAPSDNIAVFTAGLAGAEHARARGGLVVYHVGDRVYRLDR